MLCFLVFPVTCYAVWSCHQDGALLDLLYLMLRSWPSFVMLLVFSIYIVEFFVWSSCCYADAAWPSLPLVRLPGLPYLMWCCLMCSVSYCAIRSCPSDRVTLFGLVFMMLRCLVFSTSCLATQRMNFISKGFSTQNYSGSTSFSCLASAASLVAIFWFQLEKKRWRGEAPKIADSVTELMVKRQLTFIKQKPTHFHIFYLPAKACTSALGMKRRARPQTFRCQANAAQHLVSLVYTLSAK